jgi:hypothetical protein
MTDSLLALDPGKVTGWSLWTLDDDFPMTRLEYGLAKGGIDGFISFMELRLGIWRPDIIVCEHFDLDGRTRYPDLTPRDCEGALRAMVSALGLEVVWQNTDMKALCRDQTLKDHGLWLTGSDPAIRHDDARDVNDSQVHALAYAKASGHEPTVALYWPEQPD